MRWCRVVVLVGLGLLVAGCDRTPAIEPVPAPETLVTLPSCDSLADRTVDLLQGYLDAVAGMSLQELLDPAVSAERLSTYDEAGAALEARAAELGCSPDDIAAIVADRSDELRAEGPLAEEYLDLVLDRVGVTRDG